MCNDIGIHGVLHHHESRQQFCIPLLGTMCIGMHLQEAMEMGIPSAAIPQISADPNAQELQVARDHLTGMILSYQSANI